MKVFVYGSLKKGFYNHGLLSESTFIDNAMTLPKYTMYDLGGYPAIVEMGDTPIFGEVYEVNDIVRLDRLEGHPKWYRREQIPTHLGDVWVYIMRAPLPVKANRCPDGIWREKR
jgi:gamma-glutamylaminecyclotransferase